MAAGSGRGDQCAHPVHPKRYEATRLPAATRGCFSSRRARVIRDVSSPLSNEPEACWEILSNTPTAASVGTKDDPPYEMNGSGMPLVGTSDRTTLILKRAWVTIAVTKPRANSIPNRSGANSDVRIPRHKKKA